MSNLAIVQQVYAAFESGEFASVLELCDADVVVTRDDALPWGGRHEGLDGIAFDIPETHVWALRAGKIVAADFFIESSAMLVALGAQS